MKKNSLFAGEVFKPAFAELVGTFFLTLAALLAGTPYAVGLTLAAFVYGIGDVSGSHLNPGVTIGLLVHRSLPIGNGVLYIIGQIVGAILAHLVGNLVGHLQPSYQSAGVFGEFFGFGFLMLTVVAVYQKNVPKAGSGIAIGAALAAGLLTTKGVLNPAIAIGMGLASSPATWAVALSAVVFTIIYQLFSPKEDSRSANLDPVYAGSNPDRRPRS